jgi:hypothetical protein
MRCGRQAGSIWPAGSSDGILEMCFCSFFVAFFFLTLLSFYFFCSYTSFIRTHLAFFFPFFYFIYLLHELHCTLLSRENWRLD